MEWFTGELDSVSDVPGDSGKIIQIPMQEAMNYWENLRPLKLARRLRDLDTRRKDVLREIGLKRGKVPDEEIAALAAIAEGLKRRIDEERAPNRDFFEEMFGDGG